jgi:hypothetical protein
MTEPPKMLTPQQVALVKRQVAYYVMRFASEMVMSERYRHRDLTWDVRIKLTRQKMRDDMQRFSERLLATDLIEDVLERCRKSDVEGLKMMNDLERALDGVKPQDGSEPAKEQPSA